MKIVYRVDPRHHMLLSVRDTKTPSAHSLLYQRIHQYPPGVLSAADQTEVLLEQVRVEHFPSKPSRLTCVFVFEDLDTAERFQHSGWTEPDGMINLYTVTRMDGMHRGDMSITNVILNLPGQWETLRNRAPFAGLTIEQAQYKLAQHYWIGGKLHPDTTPVLELLIDGRVELNRKAIIGQKSG